MDKPFIFITYEDIKIGDHTYNENTVLMSNQSHINVLMNILHDGVDTSLSNYYSDKPEIAEKEKALFREYMRCFIQHKRDYEL